MPYPFLHRIGRKKTQDELQQYLFDDLMQQIEPELVLANSKETAAMLVALSEKERSKRFDRYEKAVEEFVRRWPKYSKEKIAELEELLVNLKKSSRSTDERMMEEIEKRFTNDTHA